MKIPITVHDNEIKRYVIVMLGRVVIIFIGLWLVASPFPVFAADKFRVHEGGFTLVLPEGSRQLESDMPDEGMAPKAAKALDRTRYEVPGADGEYAVVECTVVTGADIDQLYLYFMEKILDSDRGVEKRHFPEHGLCREYGVIRKNGDTICSYRYITTTGMVMFGLVLPDGNIENYKETDELLCNVPFDVGRIEALPLTVHTINAFEFLGFGNTLLLLGGIFTLWVVWKVVGWRQLKRMQSGH